MYNNLILQHLIWPNKEKQNDGTNKTNEDIGTGQGMTSTATSYISSPKTQPATTIKVLATTNVMNTTTSLTRSFPNKFETSTEISSSNTYIVSYQWMTYLSVMYKKF